MDKLDVIRRNICIAKDPYLVLANFLLGKKVLVKDRNSRESYIWISVGENCDGINVDNYVYEPILLGHLKIQKIPFGVEELCYKNQRCWYTSSASVNNMISILNQSFPDFNYDN